MNKKTTLGLLLYFSTVLFISCAEPFAEEEEEDIPKNLSTLHVNARSNDETGLIYPIKIYAFTPEGICAGQQTIVSANDASSIELGLPKGTYRIVALSGATEKEYNIPQDPLLTSSIEIKQNNIAKTALMMGSADVTLKSGTAKANITLNFIVAQIQITLSNIPNDYSNVEIELASSFSLLSFCGDYTESRNAMIPCSRMITGEWDTGIFYTFAGSQKKTIISIHLTKNETTETYGYTYNNTIQANHPFILTGSYAKSITVEGNIIAGGWAAPITIDFTFGKHNTEGDQPDNDDNDGKKDNIFTVTQMPEEESIWKNCLVLEITPNSSGNEADVLLMGIDNAVNDEGKDKILITDVNAALTSYKIAGISDWRMPDKTEAQFMKSRYNSNLSNINKILSNAGGTLLVEEKPRYLCNNAQSSFNFKSGTISNTGNQTLYYLRPVKTVHLIITETN